MTNIKKKRFRLMGLINSETEIDRKILNDIKTKIKLKRPLTDKDIISWFNAVYDDGLYDYELTSESIMIHLLLDIRRELKRTGTKY